MELSGYDLYMVHSGVGFSWGGKPSSGSPFWSNIHWGLIRRTGHSSTSSTFLIDDCYELPESYRIDGFERTCVVYLESLGSVWNICVLYSFSTYKVFYDGFKVQDAFLLSRTSINFYGVTPKPTTVLERSYCRNTSILIVLLVVYSILGLYLLVAKSVSLIYYAVWIFNVYDHSYS